MHERRVTAGRVLAGGCAAAILVVLIGGGLELARFGRSDAAAAARVEQDVRAAFAGMTARVAGLAHDIASDARVAGAMSSDVEPD